MIIIILTIFMISFLLIFKSNKLNKIQNNVLKLDDKIKVRTCKFINNKFKIRNNKIKAEGCKFINDKLEIIEKKIGNDKKIIILENVFKNPNEHINFIKESLEQKKEYHTNCSYPGVKIPTSEKLTEEVRQLILVIASQYYDKNICYYSPSVSDGYSIITYPNSKLFYTNLFPHKDCEYKNGHKLSGLACVIYLCNTTREYNGTGFYENKCPFTSMKFFTDKKYEKEVNFYWNLLIIQNMEQTKKKLYLKRYMNLMQKLIE